MKSYENLPHIKEYIRQQSLIPLEEFELQFWKTVKRIGKFKTLNEKTKILEVGTGIGWFPILCKKNGIFCEGLEISPQLVEYGKTLGRKYAIEPNIEIGNIEESDIGTSKYDIVITLSAFEHVEHWQVGIRRIFNALKPGGLFYFYSTNRYSLFSVEFNFPLYG